MNQRVDFFLNMGLILFLCLSSHPNPANASPQVVFPYHWQQVTPAHTPPARFSHGTAFDRDRGVTVIFGGANEADIRLNDTWEYDGVDWTMVATPQSPTGRTNILSAMVYDAHRHVTVLFGGLTSSGYVNDTWEYDGLTWTQVFPAQSPPARDAHAMVYDSNRKVVLLFGGHGLAWEWLDDTWEYDGATWTQVNPAHHPSGRWYITMAFDSIRGRAILFGGRNEPDDLDDTWEYDGIDWQQVTPAQAPSLRAEQAMGFDPRAQQTLLFGGTNYDHLLGDTWQYAGSAWTELSLAPAPSERAAGMVYDSRRSRFVLFGGGYYHSFDPHPTVFDDTWELVPEFNYIYMPFMTLE